MRVLIADDELPKLSKIDCLLLELLPTSVVEHARSVRSAIARVRSSHFDLVLLDMSLPTFDIGIGEPGGRPQGFGGIEVLRHMQFHGINAPVLVVTQYTAFLENGESVSLEDLEKRMFAKHSPNFRGCVYFGAMNEAWKQELAVHIGRVVPEGRS